MAVVALTKVHVAALAKDVPDLLSFLQTYGAMEVRPLAKEQDATTRSVVDDVSDIDVAAIQQALDVLEPLYDDGLSRVQRLRTGGRLVLEESDIESNAALQEASHAVVALRALQEQQERVRAELEVLRNKEALIEPFSLLPVSTAALASSTRLSVAYIRIPVMARETVQALDAYPEIFVTLLHESGSTVSAVVLWQTLSDAANTIDDVFATMQAERIALPVVDTPLAQELTSVREQIAALKKQHTAAQKEVDALAMHVPALRVAYDVMQWAQERRETQAHVHVSGRLALLQGFVREKGLDQLTRALEKKFGAYIETVELDEDEQPPVSIENNALFAPFEAVTRIYGLPKPGEPDPTAFLSPFFVVYFALCLTDAAYGLILFVVGFLVQRFVYLQEGARNLVRLIMFGGLFTAVIGALFGGWFGIEQERLPAYLRDITAINPLEDVLTFLGLAAGLGFVQIVVGLAINFFWKLKNGLRDAQMWGSGAWIVFLLTLAAHVGVPYLVDGGDISNVSIPLMIVMAALVSFFGGKDLLASKKEHMSKGVYVALSIVLAPVRVLTGIVSLYGLIGYVSDILSYSRLLALGLATGIVALAINIIAALARDMIPGVGIVVMVIILIGGHAFNIANNVLGAYIHSGRLQFVEFFSKFMEGGGEEWKPLKRVGRYVDVRLKQE